MNTDAVFAAADDLHEAAVAALERLVAVPSLSTDQAELWAAAELVAELAEASGLASELWSTAGAPAVFAHLPGPPTAPTLLFYGHYDVQPVDPVDAWASPPFEPTIRGDALYGRGAGDNKGQFLAHIMAVRALRQVGDCPVGVKLLIEGEEEIGSPHLADAVATHRQELTCELALTADGPYHDDGRPVIIFGVRGLLCLEVNAKGANRDVHSGNLGGLVPTPAWTLVSALARLRDSNGRVRVPSFYDAVRPPTAAERDLLERLPFSRGAMLDDLEITELPEEANRSPWESLMFTPNLNISGMSSGYTGPGTKTIVPGEATARIDVRLVPDQDPDTIESSLRAELADAGLEVARLAAVPASSTPVDTPLADPVAAGLEAATGQPPWRRPRLGGTTPNYVFTELLGVPSLLIPYGPPDMNHHAPNEKIRLTDLRRGVRATAAICMAFAESAGAGDV